MLKSCPLDGLVGFGFYVCGCYAVRLLCCACWVLGFRICMDGWMDG